MGEALAGWIEAERGRFVLFLPVAMGAAIIVYFDLSREPPLWLGLALCGLAGAGLVLGWRWPLARFFAALLLAGAVGFGRAEWRTAAQPGLMDVPYGVVALSGRVVAVDILPNGRRVTLGAARLADAPPALRRVRVRLRRGDATPINVGEVVSFRAMLFRQDRPAYPGGWDFGRDAFFQGLGASGFALDDVTVLQAARPGAFAAWLIELRLQIAARIMTLLPVSTGSVAVTLLTGFQAAMPAVERQDFIAAGLAHILAVAGLHVGIVMGLYFAASRFALSRFEAVALRINAKALAAVVALAGGAGYALLTGAHLPILRSLAMASLVTLGVLAGRRAISLRGLALAALALMVVTPDVVVGVSFQMSFSAVLALIAGYAAVQGGFARQHREPGAASRLGAQIAALAYTSLLAGGASMPFAAYQFQQIQPYWILANLVAVPLTALWILPLGLLAMALMPLGLSLLALAPMGWGIGVVVWLTEQISAWPGAMLRIEPMPGVAILLFAFGLAWLGLWRTGPRLAGLGFMLAGLLVYVAARPPDVLVSPDARLIAVRQTDAVFLLRQKKAANYTLGQWQPVWGGATMTAFGPAAMPVGVPCDAAGCRFGLARGQVSVVYAAPEGDCGPAVLVVSPEPLRGGCDAAGRAVIDRFSVWRNGAMAAWVGPQGVRVWSDRAAQGNRPWVPAWPELYGEKSN